MALQTGINIPTSDIKNALEQNNRQRNGIRTWRQLFGNASLGASADMARTTTDFSKIMADAYDTNLAQQNAILGAGLNAGATKNLLSTNRRGLLDAYDAYIRNYSETVNSISKAYQEDVSAIDTELTQRAENFAKVYNKVYDYLSQELYGSTRDDKNYFAENNMDWLLTDDEDDKRTLRSWDSIADTVFTKDGYLTDEGIEFFDQVMNARPDGYTRTNDKGETFATKGFDAWLSEADPELREWWTSADLFNYTKAGTNKGTSNVLLGRESTDDIYHKFEYLKGDEVEKYTGQALTDMSASLARAEKQIAAYDNYKAAMAANPRAQQSVYDASDFSKKEIAKAWTDYKSDVNTFNNDFVTYLQNTLGTDYYAEFYDEYRSLYTDYEKLAKELTTSTTYDANLAKKVDAYKQKLFDAADTFIGKRTGIKKASGF